MALEEEGCLILRLPDFTPGENTEYSFYRALSESQDQSGHEGLKNSRYKTSGDTS